MSRKDDRQGEAQRTRQRSPWVTPQLTRMEAGAAEAGANPSVPEGQFAFGGS